MATQSQTELDKVQRWLRSITAANKLHKDWENKYHVKALEKYYEGFQYQTGYDQPDGMPYVLNMFFSTIETKMPTLLFDNPHFDISPRPDQVLEDPETAFTSSQNLTDALNTWVDQPDNYFNDINEACLMDAWFRFSVAEIGYSADWIDNPKAPRPLIKDNQDADKKRKKNPRKIPINEQVYVKYIPADTFRVAVGSQRELNQFDWVGYYEFIHKDDLATICDIDEVGFGGAQDFELLDSMRPYLTQTDSEFMDAKGSYVLAWKIVDNRAQRRLIILPGYNKIIYDKPFTRFPFVSLRFRKPRRGFYPVPICFNWISPQNEINEYRESNRTHRRRFRRLFTVLNGAGIDDAEIRKLLNGPDGGHIFTDRAEPIQAVPTGDLGASHSSSLVVTKDDFNIISGTSADQRGQADRQTATSANIQDDRAKIRESREKIIVANFVAELGKALLMTIKNEFVNPITVSSSGMDNNAKLGDVPTEGEPREIDPVTDFGSRSFDFNVKIRIESMSPIANADEKRAMIEFFALMAQYPAFSMDPTIVRELAFRCNYRNEVVIKHVMEMAQLAMVGQMAAAQQQVAMLAGPQPLQTNGQQQQVAQQTPTTNEEVRQNTAAQLQ